MLQCNEKIIKHKVGLLNLAEELGNVSKACQIMGLSRDTFYRYRDAVEDGGVEALLERPRRAPNLKNRVGLETENAVVAYAVEYPAHGQVRVSNELRKQGDPRQDFLLRGLHTDFEVIGARPKPLFAAVLFSVELQFGGLLLWRAGAKHHHRRDCDASEAMLEGLAGWCLMIADANVGTAPSERLRRKRSHI